jgi:uncharacterized SAM-binding protein YcdF (DUF218 family)
VWTFLPTPLTLDIIDNINKKVVIYYCIDNFFVSSTSAKKIRKSEIRLLKKADLVFATSRKLCDYCSQYAKKVHFFPFGVNFSKFEKARSSSVDMCLELRDIKRPIAGYVGGIHKWIDQRLVKAMAEKFKDYSFVFAGPLQTDISSLAGLKNVHFLGNKEHDRLPLIIKDFDVCMIPYLMTDYTKNVYPTKLNEYLAMGKAVVSVNLPEVVEFSRARGDLVYIGEDEKSFGEAFERAARSKSPEAVNRRIEAARKNSWESRIQDMSDLIQNAVEYNKLSLESRWKDNLINFYRTARKKTFRLISVCSIMYLVVFKTSFVWLVASPLKISDPPQKADTIAVFGGGVGETGSPGKSTIERTRHAAQLYLKGYSKTIIFSSGYTYTYNDADNMRLLAISMGVRPEDIILEEKANSTYENVIFSKRILKERKWHSALLVSSPYNMRRAQLVVRKWAEDINVVYSPVERSQFYDRSYGVRVEQIRAIVHEYLGILYYLIKGYI